MPEPELQIPSRDVVATLCKTNGSKSNGFAYNGQIWIKYGATVKLAEAAIQRYVHDHADPRIVRIPKVFDAFRISQPDERPVTYIIMENVSGEDYATYRKLHLQEAEADQAIEAVADAVRHIWDIPLPPNAPLGPFEQQTPADRFFSDCGSDRLFNDLGELEDWINNKLVDGGYPDRVRLQGERLSICHCDLTQFNIKVGEPVAILDWGFSGVYPRAFEEFALIHQFNLEGQGFARALHRRLFGPKPSRPMRALALAARYHAFGC